MRSRSSSTTTGAASRTRPAPSPSGSASPDWAARSTGRSPDAPTSGSASPSEAHRHDPRRRRGQSRGGAAPGSARCSPPSRTSRWSPRPETAPARSWRCSPMPRRCSSSTGPCPVTGERCWSASAPRLPERESCVLSMHQDGATVREALGAGALGYVVKGAGIEHLVTALRAVAAGRRFSIRPPRAASPPVPSPRTTTGSGSPRASASCSAASAEGTHESRDRDRAVALAQDSGHSPHQPHAEARRPRRAGAGALRRPARAPLAGPPRVSTRLPGRPGGADNPHGAMRGGGSPESSRCRRRDRPRLVPLSPRKPAGTRPDPASAHRTTRPPSTHRG